METNKLKEYDNFLELPMSIRLAIEVKEPNSYRDIHHQNMTLV